MTHLHRVYSLLFFRSLICFSIRNNKHETFVSQCNSLLKCVLETGHLRLHGLELVHQTPHHRLEFAKNGVAGTLVADSVEELLDAVIAVKK